MASVINITGKDTPISGSSTGTESKNVGGFTKHAQSNRAFSKIQSYANEFVEKIIHSVIEVNDESGKCSRRNSETIYITDTVTSTVLTCSDCPTPKQGSVVMLNDGREEVGAQSDGMNKSILIQTKRILKENIDQQIEDVITESVTKATAITNLNSDNTLRRDECNREGMSDRMITVEDYAEMELSRDVMLESLCNLQQISENTANSDLSLIPLRLRAKLPPPSIAILSNLAHSNNKWMENRKRMETDSVADIAEARNMKAEKINKLVDEEIYTVLDYLSEMQEVIRREESDEKFGEILGSVQKEEANKQKQLRQIIKTPIIAAKKIPLKRTENQTDPNYILEGLDDAQDKYTATAIEFLTDRENAFENAPNGMEAINEVISSTPNNQSSALSEQKEATALIYPSDFNCSSDNPPVQMLNYTPEMSIMEVILDVVENLIGTSKQFDAIQVNCQNKSLDKEIFFEKYTNFEPPTCRLQRTPEFDAAPLSMAELLPKSGSPFQMFPDQTGHYQFISLSREKVEDITEERDNHKAVGENFSDTMNSSSGKTGLRVVGFSDVSTAQIEPSPQQQEASLTSDMIPLISSSPPVTINNCKSTTLSKTEQESIITEFETVQSESKPVLINGKFSFTGNSKHHQQEEMRLNQKAQQIRLCRPQTIPPRPQSRKPLKNPISVFLKPPLPRRPKHFFIAGKEPPAEASVCEANFTSSDCDDKKSDFSASNICQSNNSEETGLLDIFENKSSEFEKPEKKTSFTSMETMNKEQERGNKIRTAWDPENRLPPCRERSSEQMQMSDGQATKASFTSMEIIEIPHFDAKAEFDRRLSVKNSRRGEVPIIVKSAVLKSNSKFRLSKYLTDELLISSTLRLSANEKPDFSFVIGKK